MSGEAAKPIKGNCPTCGKDKYADIIAQAENSWSHEVAPISMHWDYRILKCRGCEEIYFQKRQFFSEDSEYCENPVTGEIEEHIEPTITYWPQPQRYIEPEWMQHLSKVHPRLSGICTEIYAALNNDLPILAAIGIRTALDCSTEHFEIDENLTFNDKLDALLRNGIIGTKEKATLDLVTEAGHAAAHRGWQPTEDQLTKLIDVLGGYLRRAFITDREADNSLRGQIPTRRPRKKDT